MPSSPRPDAFTSETTYRTPADLQRLPFSVLIEQVAHLLTHLGYQDVIQRGQTHRRGRNSHGGLDLQARTAAGLLPGTLLVQVKQYPTGMPVPRSFVDELRGTMLRLHATHGLIVTTSTFAPSAREAAQAAHHLMPVRLIDGEELARLLASAGIGTPASSPIDSFATFLAEYQAQDIQKAERLKPSKDAVTRHLQAPHTTASIRITVQCEQAQVRPAEEGV